ncbi:N-acyl homoserine lactonase family protein [uncultured Sphingomonas sp.]|uniref:N-acyl homoserine lactonase family protein n=1 Tax=uncultured Sphingomonas sp. TaxID=158754 RepID=UPI0035CA4580
MKRALAALVLGCLGSGVAAFAAGGKDPPVRVTLTRLDCGATKQPRDIAIFSDTRAYEGVKKSLVASCYLIRHGDELMLWDTGYPVATKTDPQSPIALNATVVEQLRALNIIPAQVTRVGVSHHHGDHTGQARDFPGATLLIGRGDWAALTAAPASTGFGAPDPAPVAHWISGGGKVEQVRGDLDVFGDGSVVMLDMPGHTPGHHSLLVKLKAKGPILLTGDLAHFQENYDTGGVPGFNTDRADTIASLDRFKAMARNMKATVVIQHDPRDVGKLPAFPAAAD